MKNTLYLLPEIISVKDLNFKANDNEFASQQAGNIPLSNGRGLDFTFFDGSERSYSIDNRFIVVSNISRNKASKSYTTPQS